MEDLILIQKIKKGDQHAFDALFNRYHKQLCYFAFMYVSDRELAEEVVSDVFLKVWVKREKIQIKSNVKAYLYTITRNIIYDSVSAKSVKFAELTDQHYQEIYTRESPERTLIHKELDAEINSIINKLPTQCRIIFMLNRHDGLKYREIAELLNISIKTVENQMGKALKILKGSLIYILHIAPIVLSQCINLIW
ncbi:RNA polymerase sigma factor [Chondrinema litorale]|uniref:RNA polymerase sigma factor n=1 Tax=Chondrinema litorale TaxID=2994555 RepID=UPI002542C80E|nr:RNA polymerase sigma-70 factor [Chondrinema litorale]UZR97322.1 RNA polymerase sigma-70 factor [Chondrinema litorale]